MIEYTAAEVPSRTGPIRLFDGHHRGGFRPTGDTPAMTHRRAANR